MKLSKAVEEFLQDRIDQQIHKQSSSNSCRHTLSLFVRAFDDPDISDVNVRTVKKYVKDRRAAGISPRTINRDLTNLITLYEWAAYEEIFDENRRNPAKGHKIKIRENPTSSRQGLTPLERQHLAQNILQIAPKDRHKTEWLLIFMAYTGLRNHEAYLLRPHELVLDHDIPHIDITNPINVKTKNAYRRVPLPTELVENFQLDYLTRYSDPNSTMIEHQVCCRNPSKYMRKHTGNPKLTAYSLRHTFARLINAAHPTALDKLEELMGHRASSITRNVYSPYTPLETLAPFTQNLSHLNPQVDAKRPPEEQHKHVERLRSVS